MSSVHNLKLTSKIKAQGCAAKISALELAQIIKSLPDFSSENLLCGTKNFEDAAVYKLSEDLAIIATIDFFPPVIDDPYLYGRIAASNALSDIYAMGGKPLLALNVFCFPTCDYPLELAEKIISGGAAAVKEAGCLLAGGHSIQAAEPIYGLSVIGTVSPQRILTIDGAKAGDALVLSKPLGTGIALLAHKGETLSQSAQKELIASLCSLNGLAVEIALKYPLHAATDITGFGFLGHLHSMAGASGLAARVECKTLPLLPEVVSCAELGLVPAAAYANRKAYESFCTFGKTVELAYSDILFDPQSSGGMLFALPEGEASLLVEELKNAGIKAGKVGRMDTGQSGRIEVI